MVQKKPISGAVIRRLPKYYRHILTIEEKGVVRISSKELSEITGFTASQIRQDLNQFGGFGQQGYGYRVPSLREKLEGIIGLDQQYSVAIVGAGRMGEALAKARTFNDGKFNLVCLFDDDPKKIGTTIGDLAVYDAAELTERVRDMEIDIVTITTPKQVAQDVCDKAIAGGAKGVWNFAPIDLKVEKGKVLENVHLDESLHTLTYYIGNIKDYKGCK